jgi:predicted nucleotidyltransferase
MTDALEVANLLVSRAVAAHGDDIDLVAMYGSRARGDAREDSDLDIFYVPRDGTDPPVARTFLLEGRLFDFWAVRWETLEGFATGRLRGWAFAPALVHHATPLHVRSGAQAERLEAVKEIVLDQMRPEAKPRMIERALAAFRDVLADVGLVRLAVESGNLADARFAAWRVVRSAIECLALANRTFFDRGLGPALGELTELEHRPEGLDREIASIATSLDAAEMLDRCDAIATGTRWILVDLRAGLPAEHRAEEVFRQAYPEIADMTTKLLGACARGDASAAGSAAWLLQADVAAMLGRAEDGLRVGGFDHLGESSATYAAIGLPDLMGPSASDTADLADRARSLDDRLRRWLASRGVDLCEYETLDDLRRALA